MESHPAAVVCKFDDFICNKATWLHQFYNLLGYYVCVRPSAFFHSEFFWF